MIIAYTGTHGTGKTTAVYDRAARLKKEYPEKTVGILTEIASRAPYPINMAGTLAGQMWIFTRQISAELSLATQYDIIVTDRTAVDVIAYTTVLGMDDVAMSMLGLVKQHIGIYDEINFLRLEDNNYLYADGVRDAENWEYRHRVQGMLLYFYQRLGVDQEERFIGG